MHSRIQMVYMTCCFGASRNYHHIKILAQTLKFGIMIRNSQSLYPIISAKKNEPSAKAKNLLQGTIKEYE